MNNDETESSTMVDLAPLRPQETGNGDTCTKLLRLAPCQTKLFGCMPRRLLKLGIM